MEKPQIKRKGLHTRLGNVGYVGSTSINIVSCAWVIHKRGRTSARDMYIVLATNLVLVVTTTWLFGPVMIAPSIAIVVAMAFAMDTRLRATKVLGLTIIALLLPFLLEVTHLGWLVCFLVFVGVFRFFLVVFLF